MPPQAGIRMDHPALIPIVMIVCVCLLRLGFLRQLLSHPRLHLQADHRRIAGDARDQIVTNVIVLLVNGVQDQGEDVQIFVEIIQVTVAGAKESSHTRCVVRN